MEINRKESFAILGTSSSDCQSLIRRRNLAELEDRLVGEGRVRQPQSPTNLPQTTTQQAESSQTRANVFDSPVTAVARLFPSPRPASSVYSRDTDENSYRSPTPASAFSNRPASIENREPDLMESRTWRYRGGAPYSGPAGTEQHLPALMETPVTGDNNGKFTCSPERIYDNASASGSNNITPLSSPPNGRGTQASMGRTTPEDSSGTSRSSPVVTTPSSATSTSNTRTASGDSSRVQPNLGRGLFSLVKEGLRDTRAKSSSVADSEETQDPIEESYGGDAQQFEKEFGAALAALERRHQRESWPQELPPGFDRIVEVGRLRRQIRSLDFDGAEMVLVASDLTTMVEMPRVPGQGEEAHPDDDLIALAHQNHRRDWFRERLAKKVQRRIALLRLENRAGSLRQIEDWYHEVLALIGWRDESEAQLPWGWRENDGFF